jgi:hypothetical protein
VKSSVVLRKAQEFLAVSEQQYIFNKKAAGCCTAIGLAGGWKLGGIAKARLNNLFNPKSQGGYWWGDFEEGYTARIIALELAALIAEEEGD